MSDAPLSIEPIVAWRTWQIWDLDETDQTDPRSGVWSVSRHGETDQPPRAGGDGRFRLVTGGETQWPPYERLVAKCGAGQDHEAPQLSCSCGIYAARSHRMLRRMGYAVGPDDHLYADVVGEVWLWGRMEESSNIYRAEFAYPKRLYLPHIRWKWAKVLAETYGVPVRIKNVFEMEVN